MFPPPVMGSFPQPPMPPQPGMPPMPGMQQMQGMQGMPMQGMSMGPMSPPLFVGHIVQEGSAAAADPSLAALGAMHEVLFPHPVTIEGIHVVPNRVTPQGFGMQGRTLPDMHTRPFCMDMVPGTRRGSPSR
jgi:hypothetical protein